MRVKAENMFGLRIRMKRRSMGLSQRDLSAKTGLSNAYICQIETARVKSPTLAACLSLGRALDVPVETLAEWQTEPFVELSRCPTCNQEIDT